MSRAVWLALAGAIGITVSAVGTNGAEPRPSLVDGKELLRLCRLNKGICQGYIAGVADVMSTVGAIHGYASCVPPTVTVKQHAAVVVKWMEAHPDALGSTAHTIVAEALAQAFPCK